MEESFRSTKINHKMLIEYGFSKQDKEYIYPVKIMNGQFELFVKIKNNIISTKLIDLSTNEEYILHKVDGAVGEFVGKVRDTISDIINDVKQKCFDVVVFKGWQTKKIEKYVENQFDCKLEYLWKKLPDCAIWRRKDNRKWFGVVMSIKKSILGLNGNEKVEILDIKVKNEEIEKIVDGKNIFHGYHMNKKNWITIILDGRIDLSKICEYIKDSYYLAK